MEELWPDNNSDSNVDIETNVKPFKLYMKSNCFTFIDQFFKQVNGTAMGSSISSTIPELVIQCIENEIICK